MAKTSYVIALGSNRPSRHGSPAAILRAAAGQLGFERLSRIRLTPALGPAGRSFANAALLLSTPLAPLDLLSELKALEHDFGRRPGRRWGPRVLDLDIILWSEGFWGGDRLTIPHPEFRSRRFVLDPLVEIVPDWRDPVTGATVRQLAHRSRGQARLTAAAPAPRQAPGRAGSSVGRAHDF